jgi:hypothetical protein
MNVIDVYDIANSTWYKQATTGTPPSRRVDPCAVVAAAPDGSSFNIYLYGGQDLVPYGSQIQYSDMWILTIPSFTWIQVDMTGQSQPPARAGHTCNISPVTAQESTSSTPPLSNGATRSPPLPDLRTHLVGLPPPMELPQ